MGISPLGRGTSVALLKGSAEGRERVKAATLGHHIQRIASLREQLLGKIYAPIVYIVEERCPIVPIEISRQIRALPLNAWM